ncbi:MAG: 30S ribosomal protein S2 [Deltaproteobacteria bacterium]|nr:30S ribosomal protein S2 [Deltaproteobacteria bacterium]
MAEVTLQSLLEAGVHFGHQVSRWNPKMKPYLFTARNGIHIIDLEKTLPMLHRAYHFVLDQVAHGGMVLFVGTKPQAQPVIEEEAKRCEMHYVNHRWLGGMLTNFRTIKQSIDRLTSYYDRKEQGELANLRKKEQLLMAREAAKMERSLGGIRTMEQLPAVVITVDPNRERIVLREANRLRIPVVALADSNCDPEGIDFLLPGNDDAMRSIRLVIQHLADGCLAGLAKRREVIEREMAAKTEADQKKRPIKAAEERKIGGRGRAYVSKDRNDPTDKPGRREGKSSTAVPQGKGGAVTVPDATGKAPETVVESKHVGGGSAT